MSASAPITVHAYQDMVTAGVLTKYDRIELIDGEMIAITPIGTRHAAITSRLIKRCVSRSTRALHRRRCPKC